MAGRADHADKADAPEALSDEEQARLDEILKS